MFSQQTKKPDGFSPSFSPSSAHREVDGQSPAPTSQENKFPTMGSEILIDGEFPVARKGSQSSGRAFCGKRMGFGLNGKFPTNPNVDILRILLSGKWIQGSKPVSFN